MLTTEQLAHAIRTGSQIHLGAVRSDHDPEEVQRPQYAEQRVDAAMLREVLTSVTDPDARGLTLSGAIVVGDLDLEYVTLGFPVRIVGSHFLGEVRMTHLTAPALDLTESVLHQPLDASAARINGDLTMSRVTAHDLITLLEARAEGFLQLDSARLLGEPISLNAGGVHVGGHAVVQVDAAGSVELYSARIEGELSLTRATLRAPVSLVCDRAQIADDIHASGLHAEGTVRMFDVVVGSGFYLWEATLNGPDVSLYLDRTRIAGDLLLTKIATAGSVLLYRTGVGGELDIRGATLGAGADPGQAPVSLSVKSLGAAADLDLRDITALGALRIRGSRIDGNLDLSAAGLAGTPVSLHVEHSVVRDEFNLRIAPEGAPVRLGPFEVGALRLPGAGQRPVLDVDSPPGWRIGVLAGPVSADPDVLDDWLAPVTSPQPREEIATVIARTGHEDAARRLRYLSAARSSARLGLPGRALRWVYRVSAGYGYYPWRALGWLVVVFAAAWMIAFTQRTEFTTPSTPVVREAIVRNDPGMLEGGQPPAVVRSGQWRAGWDVAQFHPAGYAATVAVPAAAVTTSTQWSPPAGWAAVTLSVLKGAAWVLTALLLAALTGLLRKPL
ncbi:hypothetical protein K8W59_08360 [Nocardioides rotundus]|uniref:hypothetical protein n=1 Tax=Nocardioides rotundus TaxID=1774216 RepID=UPI001CBACB5E|nr:hypothetical protein [Nocardioides rotundus]UAL31437.1 hypothetical protein K8W59_08360 [Nocardioides rotundus]